MRITSARILPVAFAAAAACGVPAASAVVVFDNLTGPGATRYFEEVRGTPFTFGTVLNSLASTTVDGIELRWRPSQATDLTLGIWDSQLGGRFGSLDWTPSGGHLLFSMTRHVPAHAGAPDTDVLFDGFSFEFQPDHRYDIGVVSHTGALTGGWDIHDGCSSADAARGASASGRGNANPGGGRSERGYACVDPHLRLLATQEAGHVPEPGSLALAGLALVGVATVGRRRRTA